MSAPRHVLEGVSASDMDSVEHDYVVAPARTYLHVSFARVQLFPVVLCVFRCRPVARLPFFLLSQTITVKLSVVTL